MYVGLIPISIHEGEPSRALYFVFRHAYQANQGMRSQFGWTEDLAAVAWKVQMSFRIPRDTTLNQALDRFPSRKWIHQVDLGNVQS